MNTVVVRRRAARFAAVLVLAASTLVAAGGSADALPPYTCGTQTGGSSSTYGHVTAVRVGHHIGFDRFVVQFSSSRVPSYRIVPKSSAIFWLDPSGQRVTLRGHAGLLVVMHPASGFGTYRGPNDFRTTFPQLREARRIGDFEGYYSWGLGLTRASCKRVFTLTAPTRLVIDVPA